MFKIVNHTKALTKFFLIFQLNLSRPQKRHVKNFIETIGFLKLPDKFKRNTIFQRTWVKCL